MLEKSKAFSSFSVNDIRRAKQFYNETLGLEVKEVPEGLELHISGGNTIFVYEKADHTPATFTILNFPVKNIDDGAEELRNRGIKFEIFTQPDIKTDEKGIHRGPGPKIAWFKDPAGNFLSILQER